MTQQKINGFYSRGGMDQFLSNFYFWAFTLTLDAATQADSPVLHLNNLAAPTVEHFFQAAKVLDPEKAQEVLYAPTARMSKQLGRRVQLRADWETVKYQAMKDILRSKFADAGLRSRLLATGDAELIEANHWHDTIWGVCTCARHQNAG